ncbi:hypothetical protein C8Q77DRAFT_417484 [Trametes polyzona]|nr:hypothetical protein C8Q77DRAFT_417484 [Trametes polyzona]
MCNGWYVRARNTRAHTQPLSSIQLRFISYRLTIPMSAPRAADENATPGTAAHNTSQPAAAPTTTMYPFTPTPTSDSARRKDGADRVRTILVFAAVVAPLALVPYALVRRRLADVRTEIAALRAIHGKLGREVRSLRENVDGGLAAIRTHVDAVAEREGQRVMGALGQAERARGERDEARRAWEDDMRGRMDALLKENLGRRTRLAGDVKDLGQSLADTAAFMQEVELRQGWTPRPDDGRGMDRTRRLARRLQETAAAMEERGNASSQEPKPNEYTRS